jgi:SAM-dependent methyltransferase
MSEQSPIPPVSIISAAMSPLISRAVYTTVALNIPDLLADGPRSSSDLAGELGIAEPRALHQLLRSAATTGLLRTEADGSFGLTADGEFLLTGHPSASRDLILTQQGPLFYPSLGQSVAAIKTGKTGTELALETTLFDYMGSHPEAADSFNRMMRAFHAGEPEAVAAAYDFSGFDTVVDVGGGIGSLLQEVLKATARASGVLFDLPHVIEHAKKDVADSPVAGRLTFAGGDFFEGVVSGGDAYLLSHVLHDWSDEAATKILQRCGEVLGPDGRILVVEGLVPAADEPHPLKMLDVLLAVCTHGAERTQDEFERLFTAAGLRLTGVTPTASMVSVLEARLA